MSTTTYQAGGRGCGDRDEGVPYLCSGLSDYGLPAEAFLIDPVRAYTTDDAELPVERGMRLIKRKGQEHFDVLNTIGVEGYFTPWCFFVEGKTYGFSRKLVNNIDLMALTPGKSQMYFLHRYGIPLFDYKCKGVTAPLEGCHVADKYMEEQWLPVSAGWHPDGLPCTFALCDLSILLENKNPRIIVKTDGDGESDVDHFTISLPGSWEYSGRVPNLDIVEPDQCTWTAGIFLHVPITGIEWKGYAKQEDLQKARQAGFDTAVLDW